jgi:hypothetical protein
MELGSRFWEMRKRGVSVYEIHRKEGIPMEAVKEILADFERCFYPDVGQMIHHYAVLDDARLEALIQRWLPAATGPAPEVAKVAKMEKPILSWIPIPRSERPRLSWGRLRPGSNCSRLVGRKA